jgi:YVTN family beta-propeller protein
VALGPEGRSLYVADLGPSNVSVIDTSSNRAAATISIGVPGTDPFNIAVTSTAVYVTDQGGGTLTVIDPKTHKVVANVTLGDSPYGVAVGGP